MKAWRMIGVGALWMILAFGVLAYAQGGRSRNGFSPLPCAGGTGPFPEYGGPSDIPRAGREGPRAPGGETCTP